MKIKSIRVCDTACNQKTRVYIFEEGKNLFENSTKRYSRRHQAYKAEVLPLVKDWLAENMPSVNELSLGYKIGWSQRAGCRCGCSPGFVVDFHGNRDIYVTITN